MDNTSSIEDSTLICSRKRKYSDIDATVTKKDPTTEKAAVVTTKDNTHNT